MGISILKEMISKALQNCNDIELLDLIYRLMESETRNQQSSEGTTK